MSAERIGRDIRNQPQSLARVLDGMRREAPAFTTTRPVVLTGMGASLFAAIPLHYRLAAMGVRATLVDAAELLHYQRPLCRDAVVVLVSRSGDSAEVAALLDALGDADTIGVTSVETGALARRARRVVLVRHDDDEMVAVQSYTGTVAALLALGGVNLDGAVERMQAAVETAWKHDWCEILEGAPVVHLIGRGPSCASCHEGALLFHETAKLPAVAASAGMFRHGSIEIVDESFRGVLFAPPGRTRSLNDALARTIAALGGRVHAIDCGAPEESAPLFEIAPVQVAALLAAEMRGFVPGRFRYVSRVTASETELD
jgi:glucosamine--fructose-6-phosphate aminotransferase (isomerizing)